MNPLSISLRNFLCYEAQPGGEPYVFDFRDHTLWSICGDNGSGKSAIFDAITYCLYGQHRGGSSRDDELVHRGATEMLASVEFEHSGKQYRVTRTIRLGVRPRKGTPTIQRECRMEWLRGDGEWVDVPETSSARGLENAVQRILGFGCDTLTASVLLLQGKSDRLIDAGGKERFDILSGILDLSRFERMAERARDTAKEARARYQSIARALEEAPPPEESAVGAAELAAVTAEQSSRYGSSGAECGREDAHSGG
jgi:exonuclease SbcC